MGDPTATAAQDAGAESVAPVDRGLLRWLIQHATKAPSPRNSQPWRFRIADDVIELLGDRSRALSVADPDHRELIVSCGAALDHLRIAAREAGYEAVVDHRPGGGDPDCLARVRLVPTGAATDDDRALFAAMHRRNSRRLPFAADRPSEQLVERFAQLGSDSTLEVRHEALVAVEPDNGELVGVSRYVAVDTTRREAEVAMVVADGSARPR